MNNQPNEHQVCDKWLDVHSTFVSIQGEGPFAGRPATFIRLAGCNLQCSFCDTEYTSGRERYLPINLVAKVKGKTELIVITGGEPFRQDISALCRELIYAGHKVQIETNGTLYAPGPWGACTIVCSPKTPKLDKNIVRDVGAFKYLVKAGELGEDGLPYELARPPGYFPKNLVYVQPLDEGDEIKNLENRKAAIWSCLEHGYTLGLQLHKILGLS